MSTEEINQGITSSLNATGSDPESAAQREKHVKSFVNGVLKLNSGDISFDSTDTKASFFNQSMGMLIVVSEQDETLLPKVERSMLTDESFLANLTRFSQVEPVRGEELVLAYEDAIRSELTNMDNQIEGALGTRYTGVLTVDPQTSKFGIDFNRLREIYTDQQVMGVPMPVVISQVEDLVKQAGGLENYFNMSASRQYVKVGDAEFRFSLVSILGNNNDIKRIFSLSPERAKLQTALVRMGGIKDSLGIISTAAEALTEGDTGGPVSSSQFVDTTDATGSGLPVTPNENVSSKELGKAGESIDNPYSFDGMTDEAIINFLDTAPNGTWVTNPADGTIFQIEG